MKKLWQVFKNIMLFPWRVLTWIREIFANLLLLVLILLLAAAFWGREEQVAIPETGALVIAPSGSLVEQRSYTDPLALLLANEEDISMETSLHDVTLAIRRATTDPDVTALVIDAGWLQDADPSKLSSIGDAIVQFKTSKKPVFAVGDHYTQAQYFLASHADTVYLNPMGGVFLNGLGVYPGYYKEALDKLKVNVHVFRVGDYKSFVEPFVRNDMSEESRRNTGLWLNDVWTAFSAEIEKQRKLEAGAVNLYINQLDQRLAAVQGDAARAALQAGLVDRIATRDEMEKHIMEKIGRNEEGNSFPMVSFKPYVRKLQHASGFGNKVGVVVASGAILDGEQPAGNIGGDTLAAQIRQIREDGDVQALVLRIDSPGGSAFAAEIIRREVQLTKEAGIPVVASFGGVAASGGYWIATTADEIWSTPNTITGSIGVFGLIPVFDESFKALGIHSDGVGTTALADAWHLDRPMNPILERSIQLEVEHTYRRFLELAAEGRGMETEKIHAVAQGQVWSGLQARELGLVDHLGDLDDAIMAAAKLAKLGDDYEWEFMEPELSPQEQFIRQLTSEASRVLAWAGLKSSRSPSMADKFLASLQEKLAQLATFNDPRGVYVRCMECDLR